MTSAQTTIDPQLTPIERLRAALRDRHSADTLAKSEPPVHLKEVVTLKSRNLTRSEWKTLLSKHYPRLELADHFWPGMAAWLKDNVSEFFLTGGMDEERNDEGMSAWFILEGHFADADTAMLFRMRWS